MSFFSLGPNDKHNASFPFPDTELLTSFLPEGGLPLSSPSELLRPSLYLSVTLPPSASWVTLPTLAHLAPWKDQLLMANVLSFPCFFPPVSATLASAGWRVCWLCNQLLLLFVVGLSPQGSIMGHIWTFNLLHSNFFHSQNFNNGSSDLFKRLNNLTSIAKPNRISSFSLDTHVSLLSLVLNNRIIVY